jgi:hypothetical protein
VKKAHQFKIADIRNWLAGGEEENLEIKTDEEIIDNLLEDYNSENDQESSTPLQVLH